MHDTPPGRRIVEIATNHNGDGTICVAVRDYGSGISETTRERLFEQFFTTKEDGLGMGLAIVRSIVEAHGGSIAAENADGGGARFHFRLPIKEGIDTMMTPTAMVFVIDDDASMRKSLERLLDAARYKVELFKSASEFLSRSAHAGPSCVIVDVRMPGLNGIDFQKVLIEGGREEQLVFITGHGDIPMCAQGNEGRRHRFSPEAFQA